MSAEQRAMRINPSDMIAEDNVYVRWPMLKPGELRRARKRGDVDWFAFSTGPHYTPDQISEYVARKYLRRRPCEQSEHQSLSGRTQAPSNGKSADIISTFPTLSAEAPTTPANMTPELAQSAAELLAQQILEKPSASSSHSSPGRQSRRMHLTRAR